MITHSPPNALTRDSDSRVDRWYCDAAGSGPSDGTQMNGRSLGRAVAAYNTATGVLVLAIGGGVSVVAYRGMIRIAKLPTERRGLR